MNEQARECQRKLDQHSPAILELIEIKAYFINVAVANGALSRTFRQDIEAGKTTYAQADLLLQHIRKDLPQRYLGFIETLVCTDQRGILETLGETKAIERLKGQKHGKSPLPLTTFKCCAVSTSFAAPVVRGRLLIWLNKRTCSDIAWTHDGSLLIGSTEVTRSVEQVYFSPDYKRLEDSSSRILHSGSSVCRINTGPNNTWAFCTEEGYLYVNIDGNLRKWETPDGMTVIGVSLSADNVIFSTPTDMHVCNKSGDLQFKKEITDDAIQFVAYRPDDCMVFTTGQPGSEQELCIAGVTPEARAHRIRDFGEEFPMSFKAVGGLTCDRSSNTYIIDRGDSCIHVFNRNMRYIWALELEPLDFMGRPWSLALFEQVNGSPLLAISDGDAGHIAIYELS